jgi:serine phosphatase RsbU (regulator of sigma subunit)/anti-sigma regulatory factor (Ser/Thr protein kinase)
VNPTAPLPGLSAADLLAALRATTVRLHLDGRPRGAWGPEPDGPPAVRAGAGPVLLEAWGEPHEAAVSAAAAVVGALQEHAVTEGRLTRSLVEAHDRLLLLQQLAEVPFDSLEGQEVLDRLVVEVVRLTRAGAAVLVGSARPAVAGADPALRDWLAGLVTGPARAGARFLSGPDRTAVVSEGIGPIEAPVVVGLARSGTEPFGTADGQLVRSIGHTVARTLRLTRLHREAVARVTIERDYEAASELARAVLPPRRLRLSGVELFARSVPARSAGGDFYTTLAVDGTLFFSFGDVAGKGLTAALVMTRVLAAGARAFLDRPDAGPTELLARVDAELYPYLSEIGLFATMALGVHRLGSGVVRMCNAGHSPTLAVHAEGVRAVPPSVPPLGVLPGQRAESEEIRLGPGDLLVVSSDGFVEQEDPAGAMFGYERFMAAVAALHGRSAEDVGDRLYRMLSAHAAGAPMGDDRTLLVLRSHGEVPGPTRSARLELAGDLLSLRSLGPWLTELLAGRPADAAARLELALHEICVNVVDHAYAGAGGPIRVAGLVDDQGVQLWVRDRGRPYTPPPGPPAPPEELQVRGYGLAIVRQLVDELRYERVGDENVWELTAGWRPARPGEEPWSS